MAKTVEIPGGTAVLRTSMSEASERLRRPVQLLATRIGKKLTLIESATRLLIDGDVVDDRSDAKNDDGTPRFTGGDVEVTEKDLSNLFRLNDLTALALLVSWDLPIPLPRDEDAWLDDVPGDVIDALREAVAGTGAEAIRGDAAEFGPDAADDLASPTGASDGSTVPSEAATAG